MRDKHFVIAFKWKNQNFPRRVILRNLDPFMNLINSCSRLLTILFRKISTFKTVRFLIIGNKTFLQFLLLEVLAYYYLALYQSKPKPPLTSSGMPEI